MLLTFPSRFRWRFASKQAFPSRAIQSVTLKTSPTPYFDLLQNIRAEVFFGKKSADDFKGLVHVETISFTHFRRVASLADCWPGVYGTYFYCNGIKVASIVKPECARWHVNKQVLSDPGDIVFQFYWKAVFPVHNRLNYSRNRRWK